MNCRLIKVLNFLADHTPSSTIGYWYDGVVCLYVRLSVCLSVTLCNAAKRYILQQKCLNK